MWHSVVSVFPTDTVQTERKDPVFLHFVFPGLSRKPSIPSVLRVDRTNKTEQRLTAKAH